ncbi:glycerol-3-phosphate transporter ATP-binding subunit [compost metagenome]
MGIRSEDIHDEPIFLEGSPNTIVNANVEVTENLGHEMFLHLAGLGANTVVARVDGRSAIKDGTSVKLAFDMNKVHFFDKESTESILIK